MEVKTAFKRPDKHRVCRYWIQGTCIENPCKFVHWEPIRRRRLRNLKQNDPSVKEKNPNILKSKKGPSTSSNSKSEANRAEQENGTDSGTQAALKSEPPEKSGGLPKQCKYWITGNCAQGDKCKDLHSWFCGSGFTMLAKLEGHSQAITGISLPSGGDKLYSSGKDGSLGIWDCNNGRCVASATSDSEIGCLVAKGEWLFAGVQDGVKAWDFQNQTEVFLNGPAGLVCSAVMSEDYTRLFVGNEDGSILVWKWHPETKNFEAAAMVSEHKGAVRSLIVGGDRLYSGSADSTIKVWDLQNLECLQTLRRHTKDVTSLLCWDRYLLSASSDNTLKVWARYGSGTIEMVFEIKYNYAVITLCGIHDAEAKPILLCSFGDSTVRLYDLPSFRKRGKIFSRREVHTIQIGVGGLFFTGDATGEITVWKLA